MKKILIADDEKEWALMLCARLQHEGFEIEIAFDAIQATTQALQLKPDLILLDISMPAGGGIAVLENLRGSMKTSHIPVIVITARGDAETRESVTKLGISGYHVKPIEMADLLKNINALFC